LPGSCCREASLGTRSTSTAVDAVNPESGLCPTVWIPDQSLPRTRDGVGNEENNGWAQPYGFPIGAGIRNVGKGIKLPRCTEVLRLCSECVKRNNDEVISSRVPLTLVLSRKGRGDYHSHTHLPICSQVLRVTVGGGNRENLSPSLLRQAQSRYFEKGGYFQLAHFGPLYITYPTQAEGLA
jgi:hypothetical protein